MPTKISNKNLVSVEMASTNKTFNKNLLTVAFLLISAFLVSGCAFLASYAPSQVAVYLPGIPEIKARGMVERAASIHKTEGQRAAIRAVQSGKTFNDGEFYVFATNANNYGILANPAFPGLVGQSLKEIKQPNGGSLSHIVDKATEQGGWVRWQFYNPETKKAQYKTGWILKVGAVVYGCGVYESE